MAVIRVHKNENYTVLSNYHFKEKRMSLKAKGLLSLMLSLPENWDYSVAGLVTLSKDGKDSVNAALKELEAFGYLKRTQTTDESGKFSGYDYEIFENPSTVSPFAENPSTAKPTTGKPQQLSKKESNTKKSKTKKLNTEVEEEERKKEKAPTGYDAIINNFIFNEKVKETICEFIKMRKLIKKPLTNYALKMLIEKLGTLSDEPSVQIAILEKSILNNWQDIFPIKEEQPQTPQQIESAAPNEYMDDEEAAEIAEAEKIENKLQYFRAGVMLTDKQIGDLLERMELETFEYYVDKLADYISKRGTVINHYSTILRWYTQDSAVAR